MSDDSFTLVQKILKYKVRLFRTQKKNCGKILTIPKIILKINKYRTIEDAWKICVNPQNLGCEITALIPFCVFLDVRQHLWSPNTDLLGISISR